MSIGKKNINKIAGGVGQVKTSFMSVPSLVSVIKPYICGIKLIAEDGD